MEKEIRDRFNESILQQAMAFYAIKLDDINLLDGFESFMYEFNRDGTEYILRLGHTRRRSPNLIRGEVDWINYLANGGAGVARAVLSQQGNLVEAIPDERGGQFLATAFIRAQGAPVWQMGGWTDALLQEYGRLLGRIHTLSSAYQLPDPAWHRGHWHVRENLGLEDILSSDETLILKRYQHLMRHLIKLPSGQRNYGMIHQDAHAGNFFVDESGNFTLFDFDDCLFGHYVYDLAMVLFYAVTNHPDPIQFGEHFWHHFWRGYCQEYTLDPPWLAELPHFMKLREIDLYAIVLRDYDILAGDQWVETFLKGRKQKIEQGIPYLALDLDQMQRR